MASGEAFLATRCSSLATLSCEKTLASVSRYSLLVARYFERREARDSRSLFLAARRSRLVAQALIGMGRMGG